MPPSPTPAQAQQRARLLEVARRRLEDAGPDALQARSLTAEFGASTQAVYTLFGGMPAMFAALVADGFARLAEHVDAVPETDDPVADFFTKGAAYCDWALAHPQLYRLMFGLSGHRPVRASLAHFPEGRAGLEVMVRALDRVQQAGRIRPADSLLAAGQFLSATHGYVLLEIVGMFGDQDLSRQVIGSLGINLMIGLGDRPKAAMRSLGSAAAARDALSASA